MPAVSVIMPAYNVEPYIEAAVRSVLAQTFEDFELIIVDDGATDGTYDAAGRAAGRDGRVRIIRQANSGLSAARNAALAHAHAPFVALLDSDDLWAPVFLERQMAILQDPATPDIVTGNAWNLGGARDGDSARPYPDTRPSPDLTGILADELSVFIMSVFRRRVYEVIGGFDETLSTNEDYDFWLRAAIAGFTFARNDEPLAFYRRRDDSLSASDIRMLRGILRVYAKQRPSLLFCRPAIDILDLQIKRFEAELIAAEARLALEKRDFTSAKEQLALLQHYRGGPMLGLARVMARWTPGLLWKAYQLRRRRQAGQES